MIATVYFCKWRTRQMERGNKLEEETRKKNKEIEKNQSTLAFW